MNTNRESQSLGCDRRLTERKAGGNSEEDSTDLQSLLGERKTERREGHMKDALAPGGEEGRDKLR